MGKYLGQPDKVFTGRQVVRDVHLAFDHPELFDVQLDLFNGV